MPQYLHFVTLDVFTKQPFSGNPLAVVFLPTGIRNTITQEQKQIIAREFNYSETIFVHPLSSNRDKNCDDNDESRTIDIFTTAAELPFAGHPVIGAASWLLCYSQEERVIAIETKAGNIPISLSSSQEEDSERKGVTARIPHSLRIHKSRFPLSELLRLHPSLAPFFQDTTESKEEAATNEKEKGFPVVSIVKGMNAVLVELPNLAALAAGMSAAGGELLPTTTASEGGYLDEGWQGNGLVCTYFYVRKVGDDRVRNQPVIRSRMILGSLEDPATGSAACSLAGYLSLSELDHTALSNRRSKYHVVQGVEMGRRSDIGLEIVLDEDRRRIDSVELSGSAVKICAGGILVPT